MRWQMRLDAALHTEAASLPQTLQSLGGRAHVSMLAELCRRMGEFCCRPAGGGPWPLSMSPLRRRLPPPPPCPLLLERSERLECTFSPFSPFSPAVFQGELEASEDRQERSVIFSSAVRDMGSLSRGLFPCTHACMGGPRAGSHATACRRHSRRSKALNFCKTLARLHVLRSLFVTKGAREGGREGKTGRGGGAQRAGQVEHFQVAIQATAKTGAWGRTMERF